MNKLLVTLAGIVLACLNTMAQDQYVAVLNHEGTLSSFYGYGALKEAYEGADGGESSL